MSEAAITAPCCTVVVRSRDRCKMKARVLWLGPPRRCKIKDHSLEMPMITGVHALIYSKQADAVRIFFRDTLGLPSVDSGGGWLIFALPPAELGVHPSDGAES